jgi:hypothetical protein
MRTHCFEQINSKAAPVPQQQSTASGTWQLARTPTAALDLTIVKLSVEQLAGNQDLLARKEDQMAQTIATLQAAEQDLSQKVSSPPTSGAAHAPQPEPLQPAAR